MVESKVQVFGALGASIEAEVLGDLEVFSKEEEAFQDSGGEGVSNDGKTIQVACFSTCWSGLIS